MKATGEGLGFELGLIHFEVSGSTGQQFCHPESGHCSPEPHTCACLLLHVRAMCSPDVGPASLRHKLTANPPDRPSAATASVRGEAAEGWAFHLHELGQGHWVAVARAPLSAVVDAWGVSLLADRVPAGVAGALASALLSLWCRRALGGGALGFDESWGVMAGPFLERMLHPTLSDCAQGFKATFQRTDFAPGEWQEQLHAPEPPFTMLSVADLVPPDQRAAYAAAGGELL